MTASPFVKDISLPLGPPTHTVYFGQWGADRNEASITIHSSFLLNLPKQIEGKLHNALNIRVTLTNENTSEHVPKCHKKKKKKIQRNQSVLVPNFYVNKAEVK